MLHYVARRILLMIPTLFVISALVYLIIDLPPGDCVTTVPFGWIESTLVVVTVKPACESVDMAAPRLSPTTFGTLPEGGAGADGKLSAGRPNITLDM